MALYSFYNHEIPVIIINIFYNHGFLTIYNHGFEIPFIIMKYIL